ncbi:hypothetical protein [Trichloromonas acetexigens]|uniref:Pilus assembly protein PilM n=1 Tax=Trichloromonas acetexigens TaxID=38815 RepID=A0A550J8A6_9BACT|nr:hypothetical protein [Desulfuromonas acetexigens]TRO79478.1 hypothetical protein FL622_13095 [Desulfuromonas acetexigens]
MIRRTFLGLDLCGRQLQAAALRRRGTKAPALVDVRLASLAEESWSLSVREPNIRDRAAFIAAVKSVLDPIARGEDRIALSLPDPLGRILLAEVETAFKSHQEGIEVLKWQLKKSLPAEPREVRLDYQVVEKTETGRYRVLVSLMLGSVLGQYEEVLAEAGYHPVVIDFHAMHRYNFYRPRIDLGEDFILVGVDGDLLGLQLFQGKIPVFQRHKRISGAFEEIFQEINLSFASVRESFPGFQRAGVFLHTAPPATALMEVLKAAFEREVRLLDPKIEQLAPLPLPQLLNGGTHLAAAVGAAERLL